MGATGAEALWRGARCGLGTSRNRPSPKHTPAGPGGGRACGGMGDRVWTRWVRPGSVWGQGTAGRVNIRRTPRAASDGPEGEVWRSWSQAEGPGGGDPTQAVLLRGHNGRRVRRWGAAGRARTGAGSGPPGPRSRLPVSVEVSRRGDVPFPDPLLWCNVILFRYVST